MSPKETREPAWSEHVEYQRLRAAVEKEVTRARREAREAHEDDECGMLYSDVLTEIADALDAALRGGE